LEFTLQLQAARIVAAPGKHKSDVSAMHKFENSMCKPFLRSNAGRNLFAAALALACLGSAIQPADARHLSYRHRRGDRDPTEKIAEQPKPSGPLFAVVSLADEHVSFYDANGLWARSIISTGVDGHPTPTGIFTILEKERWHHSNIYSGAPMPFMQRVTWTGVAMHEGVVTGRPASHGCIRLPGAFAKRMFGVTKGGERVIISPQDVTPSGIVHAHLPAPQLLAPPPAGDGNASGNGEGKALETVALDKQANAQDQGKLLNPYEFAQALKAAASAKAANAIKAKKAALQLLETKSDDARRAARELDAAEDALRRAKDILEDAGRILARAQGDEAIKKATERKTAAEEKLAAAEKLEREARDAKAAKDQDLISAQTAVRDAENEAESAALSAKSAETRGEPISIFISRKTQRLYVRQATQHLFDVPITIRDPGRPLGSHLFIATKAGEGGASLQWVVLTPPAAIEVKVRRHSSRRGRRIAPEEEAPHIGPFPETASAALDRIEIPPEAAHRIAERLWVGGTLIISDVGMSGEGRYAMDFMILGRTPIREE
jgi:hypothetical protein